MVPFEHISYFKPYEPGVFPIGMNGSKEGSGLAFAFDAGAYLGSASKCGVIIYDGNSEYRVDFSELGRSGALYGLAISGLKAPVTYNFYSGKDILLDRNARLLTGNETFGKQVKAGDVRCIYLGDNYDWSEDKAPGIKYENAILYGLNVRAFTMDKSSKVKAKGTFLGITEKVNYLKELGITSIVLMPAYEFDECENIKRSANKPRSIEEAKDRAFENIENSGKINCWGFSYGYYYAPKSSYALNCAVTEFKDMVKTLHANGLELIMQMYFPPRLSQYEMVKILRFWVNEYHVDGFRINGFYIPHRTLINDPVLCTSKLWFDYIPYEDIEAYEVPSSGRVLASNHGNFRYDIRRLLKSDEGLISDFINYQKTNPEKLSVINYICDYDGFSLYDLYSYERKHNEANGENNRDGCNENFSWNCGIEGPSRKKAIVSLRIRQVKNALALLFLCQGTPYIFSGDEFGNSRLGNNNCYCQDNETGFVNWKENKIYEELLGFTKEIIALRKANKVFHMATEPKNMDTIGCGYPDLSYHGFEAYRPDLHFNSRCLGMFFAGEYSGPNAKSYYVGINMHWQNHRLAVPKLKNKKEYVKVLDTGESNGSSKDNEIPVSERSVVIFEA